MRAKIFKSVLVESGLGVSLLFAAAGAFGQQAVNLSAGPATALMPDGTSVPMWGYSCGAPVAGSTATCAALNKSVQAAALAAAAANQPPPSQWSPVVITIPSGQSLQINLTNNLLFTPAGSTSPNAIPTSIVIVGQLGGGLGSSATYTASPAHAPQGVTWPTVGSAGAPGSPGTFTPPAQGPRVQSFATEVVPAGVTPATGQCGSPCTTLVWNNLNPGTYLIESGTHPSIQGPMGLYGVLVVTNAPSSANGVETSAGQAYPGATADGVPYDADVPLELSEIDPVQNKAVSAAVNHAGFSETAVWSGLPNGCGNPSSSTYQTCYPPAVNYTPLYFLINGTAFDRTNAAASLFAVTPAQLLAQGAGGAPPRVLVRLVNAGLRMHTPTIVGAQTQSTPISGGTAAAVGGFSLIAEDGNPLPGLPRIQSEVFMAAGKTYDVMINAPSSASAGTPPPSLAIYDRALSLSGDATERDAGMLAYIGVNGAGAPGASSLGAAVARADTYNAMVDGQPVTVSDPSKGVIANDTNVYGVALIAKPSNGTVTLNANGTFVYTPVSSSVTSDQFTYIVNGGTSCNTSTTAPNCATVNLGAGTVEDPSGITMKDAAYTASTAQQISIDEPGVLGSDFDAAGYPLSVVASSVTPLTGTGGTGTLVLDPDGGFHATVPGPGTYTFTYKAQNSQGTVSTTAATVTLVFPAGSGLKVAVVDGHDKTTPITDYRWIIEEDQTFYVDPSNTTNTSISGGNTVPTFGVNFHTSHMPFVAQGCTGPQSCENGQTLLGKPAICDVGDGVCRTTDAKGQPLTGDNAEQTPLDPSQVVLDPSKRYYISVLPGDAATPFANGYSGVPCGQAGADPDQCVTGHGMGGAEIAALCAPGSTTCPASYADAPTTTVLSQPTPYQPGKLSVFVFEDDFPLNGENDAGGGVDVLAPNEPGLGGFNIQLWDAMGGNGDFTGQMTYDMFNQPLSNSLAGTIDPVTGEDACPISVQDSTQPGITGMIVTCPKYEADGKTLSPLAGQAIIANLMPGRFGVVATPGADRIARGEEWHQTNTLDGQKAHDSFIRVGEPSYFQEYGPASYHVTIGFANPAIINGRLPGVCNGSDINLTLPSGAKCTNTLVGRVTTERMSRTPDERLYSSASHDSFYWTQCYVSVGDPDGEDFAFAKCDDQGRFRLTGLPDGDWRVTVFDQWNDMLVDGLSTPVALSAGNDTNCPGNKADGVSDTNTCDIGDIATNQWQANIYTRTFLDKSESGISSTDDDGVALVPTAVRYRDGSLANLNSTDFTGAANFNETFPLFNWYVVETDTTRYKNTGTHVVYDSGGPADGTLSTCEEGNLPNGTANYPSGSGYPPCGTSIIGKYLANTIETVSLPTDLRVPGSIYCADADCTGKSMNPLITGGGTTNASDPPSSCTLSGGQWSCSTELSTGRVDDPWMGGTEGWQGFAGQNNFIEFGKAPYAPGENGGIRGHVVYASTRPFDDPTLLVQTQWEPLVPHVRINLYQEGTGSDGRPTLTLVDHTMTSSWDDWAQGFHTDAQGNKIPNMNCPGQSTSDLFFFTLANQPNYLDVYNAAHSGGTLTPTALPDQSQFKCYDGMHDWNQVQPAPYDGMYSFPSVTSIDPATGKPSGTNCTICGKDPATDMYAGVPMLPPGKYVVEVVVPPGFELVKEEDKNILIGDDYIAPATQEFGALGDIFILPDQASISAEYNANNAVDPTSHLESYQGPSNGQVPGFIPEPVWPCVGETRIVPDYISLFPWTQQVAPFAGASRRLCDRKEVTLTDQTAATAKFYVFTSTHIAAKFTGLITDDFTSEFDPFSPAFGEKFSPPNMPVSFRDWAGNETSRVYSDHWGAFNGLTYSSWEVNPPNPTGYAPTMMVTCMNDPGPIPDPNHPGQMMTDPLFNPAYSQFCYELPYMPGQTQYMDTPVVPTAAFAGSGYNNVDCAYPDETPAVKEVDGDGVGPWVGGPKGAVISIALSNGGSGYSSAPAVHLSGGGGTGASATASLVYSVASVTMITGGGGYTSAPTVTFTGGGGGSGASGVATITNGVTIAVTNGGSGYRLFAPPKVTISGGGGSGATATAVVNLRGQVALIIVTNPGSGYTSAPTVTISGGGGTGATAVAALSGRVTGVTVTNGGSGYTSAPAVTFSGGGGRLAFAVAAISGSVQSVSLTSQGSGYTSAPAVTFSGGGGSGAAATASIETNGTLTITALGDSTVGNYGYSGPSATQAPWNEKFVTRHYGFGACTLSATTQLCTNGASVTIGGQVAKVASWSDSQIVVSVPSGVASCPVQQQAQYGGSSAQCGQLVITAANGKSSIDSVTVTIGGKAPTVLSASDPLTPSGPGAIQRAIDAALPGDLIIVPPGTYNEMVIMWKPVRLQGVGAASSVINANTQPAGKLDPWRHEVNCLFGLALNGTPISGSNPYDSDNSGLSCPGSGWNAFSGEDQNPQIDRLPLEGIVGWDTTTNGNLAQLLQEPTLMGAYEGAAITVLAKGVNTHGLAGYYGSGSEAAFPTGSTVLTVNDCTTGPGHTNPYPSNFQCNPSSIDGLGITDSSQGGGGIFVHAWAHNLQIANNRVYNNIGTLSGGINVGQGESPDAYLAGTTGDTDPGSCESSNITNLQLPYCFDMHLHIHNNYVSMNTSIGDELFSGTPAGAGGVSICTGADYYLFDYNWVCGNLSTGDGGGVSHLGFIKNGDIEHNAILFNQSTNPTIATNGGGLIIEGAAPDGFTASGLECGSTAADADCPPGLPDGTGQNLVINANLIMGNAAESGSGGGLRLQSVNGTEIAYFPRQPDRWNSVTITNNIIANNVAGWDGGGISLQDAMNAEIVNNTIVSNDTTASSGVLFNTLGAPLASAPGATNQTTPDATASLPQPAGLVTMPHSTNLAATIPLNRRGQPQITCPSYNLPGQAGGAYRLNCATVSDPFLENNVFWQNRAFQIGVGGLSAQYQQDIVSIYNASFDKIHTGAAPLSQTATGQCVSGSSYWDMGVRGDAGPGDHSNSAHAILAPFYSVLTNASENGNGARNKLGTNPGEAAEYCNGARTPPEAGGYGGWQVPPGISDATVPNPLFTLTPSATVDEGNNWVNLNWGPLSLVNPQTQATLGNYQLSSGSPAIGAGTSRNAPANDFFGLPRGSSIDIGATEYRAGGNPPIP